MKQSKPYGQPCTSAQYSIDFEDKRQRIKKIEDSCRFDVFQRTSESEMLAFNIGLDSSESNIESRDVGYIFSFAVIRNNLLKLLSSRYLMIYFLVAVFLCFGICFIRDYVKAVTMIETLKGEHVAMNCSEGRFIYANYFSVDFLLGNGRFVCSEWVGTKRYITLPNGPNFR